MPHISFLDGYQIVGPVCFCSMLNNKQHGSDYLSSLGISFFLFSHQFISPNLTLLFSSWLESSPYS